MNIEITNDIQKANAITHNGCFHADELFATVVIILVLKNVILARVSEIPKKLKRSPIIYDIGGGVFDHHQPNGNGARENGIRYSSFGLLWKAYGIRVLEEQYNCSSKNAQILFEMIDEDLVQSIDCIDNGQLPLVNFPAKVKSISSSLADFYPNWNEFTPGLENERFLDALNVAYHLFNNTVLRSISKLMAREPVETAIAESKHGILLLPEFMPWERWLCLSTNPKAKHINFVVFPANRDGFTIMTVPKAINSKFRKKLFPDSWAGLSGKKLQERTQVESALFCHAKGFIASSRTLYGALMLARLASVNVSKCS